MNADWIIATSSVIETVLEHLEHRRHALAQVPDANIFTVAVMANKFSQNHIERVLGILRTSNYRSGILSISHFNRRLHALADWLAFLATAVTLDSTTEPRILSETRRFQTRCNPSPLDLHGAARIMALSQIPTNWLPRLSPVMARTWRKP